MATDGPTPKDCDPDIYKNGIVVQVCTGLSSNRMENWVRQVAEKSGQPVDWHYMGGRATVLTTGSLPLVAIAMEELAGEYQKLALETREQRCAAD